MLNVFCNIDRANDWSPMWFDLNGDEYRVWNNNSQDRPAQFDIEIPSPSPDPSISVASGLCMDLLIWDNYENQMWSLLNERPQTEIIVSNIVDDTLESDRVIYNDFLFNRTKAYYQNYPFPSGRRWYYVDSRAYEPISISDAKSKTHVYVAPNKSYHTSDWRNIRYRPRLVDHLVEHHRELGYIGDYHRHPDLVLYPHYLAPDCANIGELKIGQAITQNIRGALKGNLWGYSPPHNLYYQDTFVSVYSETIEHGTTWAVTEKTLDPMIKGHFVLPFSNFGFVGFLRRQGWLLPEFIDYSYDLEPNNDRRFELYLREVDRLLCQSLDVWQQLWQDNIGLLKYNQQRFADRDYDRVDLTGFL